MPTVTVDSAIDPLAFDHLVDLGTRRSPTSPAIVGTHTAADRRGPTESFWTAPMAPIELNAGSGRRPANVAQTNSSACCATFRSDRGERHGGLRAISSLGSRGLSVPNDVSVVGFDGLVLGARSNPPLTLGTATHRRMGRIAISLAERAAQNAVVEDVVLQPRLLVRSSTGPAR